MRNILMIIFIVIAMGYMVNILVNKYNTIVQQQEKQKQEQKKIKE
ncbi:MAG: hypothetical protein ACQERD_07475 [Campylobacterota bacterium]